MIEKISIDSEKYYSPTFSKYVSYEVTKEYYPLIGELISIFNGIENDLNDSLITLINNEKDELGWILISELPYSSKVKIWTKIIELYINDIEKDRNKNLQKIREDFNSFEKKLVELGEERNAVAHADWDFMNENLYVKTKTKSSKKGIEHFHIKLNKEEFDKLIGKFDNFSSDFLKFTARMNKLFKK